ncbi:hypothetical protein SAY86_008083 [Trapa natans]|uniref:Uncharacterized protein n=1 Tax=Trapa natans TaxID=22666 RepID=A0AAN7K7V9_TRANT|nr:hypothetical protein SAY86_008083 [Trapa natans]
MVAMVSSLGVGVAYLHLACHPRQPSSNLRYPRWNAHANTLFSHPSRFSTQMGITRSIRVLASNPNRKDDATSFKEDLSYLLTLGVCSLAGAALIKYGSVIFPEVTRPNIWLALIIISTPVVISVFLLAKQSQEMD